MPRKAEEHLFDFFTKAANEFYPEPPNGFVCPLCVQTFDSLDHLSRAHLWPEALGGRIFALACRRCNSRIGSSIEKHEKARVDSLSSPGTYVRMRSEGAEGDVGVRLLAKNINDQPTMIFDPGLSHSKPSAFSELQEVFRGGKADIYYKPPFVRRRADLTHLHFAYMSLFHLTGYSWVITSLAACIRQQLDNPDETTFPIYILSTSKETLKAVGNIEPAVLEVLAPSKLHGYLVATPELKYKDNRREAIWMPISDNIDRFPTLDDFRDAHFGYKLLTNISRKPGGFMTYERVV